MTRTSSAHDTARDLQALARARHARRRALTVSAAAAGLTVAALAVAWLVLR